MPACVKSGHDAELAQILGGRCGVAALSGSDCTALAQLAREHALQSVRSMAADRFGTYRLVEKIGRGSAGTVFVGEYATLRLPIAIKILHEHLVADGSADRMLAEARALSVLDHPGIVKVLDCGMTSDGRAYIVMEYLAGELLHRRLRRGPLCEPQVMMFARQLASALEVAHATGIIHRDVKPENAFVVPDPDVPGGERIKLLDFGIAKCGDLERTQTGVVLGTPAYMAPEQFAASRHVDHRADIYALGVVMYAMSTGTLPFEGSDTDELRAEHSYCLPRPATASGVSSRLSEIIDCCLAKDPRDRFASMAQLGAALRELELDRAHEWAHDVSDDMLGPEPDPLDELTTAALATHGVRTRLPWRSMLGAVAAIAGALVYAQWDDGSSRERSPPPAVVVRDPSPAIERPAVAPRAELAPRADVPAEPRDVTVRREPTALVAKTDQRRRDATRARQRAVRREPVRAEASPTRVRKVDVPSANAAAGTRAPTKEEDYASVTPPTLY